MEGSPQTQAQKQRQNRAKSRAVIADVEGDASKFLGDSGMDELQKTREQCNAIFDTVTTTREAAVDSKALTYVTGAAKRNAMKTNKGGKRPTMHNFVQSLKNAPGFSSRNGTLNWAVIGQAARSYVRLVPGMQTMYGGLGAPPSAKRVRQTGPRQAKPTQATQYTTSMEEADRPDNSHEKDAQLILKALAENTKNGPVPFEQFVFNPDSFSQTIENIFSMSHLVKEGRARHFVDEDGVQMLDTTSQEEFEKMSSLNRVACVISFDYRTFNQLGNSDLGKHPSMIPSRGAAKRARPDE